MNEHNIWTAREQLLYQALALLQSRLDFDLHPEAAHGSDHVDYCVDNLTDAARVYVRELDWAEL